MMTAFICNDAGYPCVLFRYSVGTIPVSFLNTFEKYLGSVKPTAKAMLLSVSSVLRNISHAFLIRIWRTKSTGVIPVVAFTLLYSTLRLIPISFEISSILSSGLPAFSTINLKARIMVLSCICAAINASSLFGSTASLSALVSAWLIAGRGAAAGSIRKAAMASLSPASFSC